MLSLDFFEQIQQSERERHDVVLVLLLKLQSGETFHTFKVYGKDYRTSRAPLVMSFHPAKNVLHSCEESVYKWLFQDLISMFKPV